MAQFKYIYELAKIEWADLAPDGGPGTVFVEPFSDSIPGTVAITTGDPTVTAIRVLEKTQPIISSSVSGDTTVTFSTHNVDPPAVQTAMGGTLTGTAPNQTWRAPLNQPELIKTVRFTTPAGRVIIINKLSIFPKLGIVFNTGEAGRLDMTGTMLAPDKDGVEPMSIT